MAVSKSLASATFSIEVQSGTDKSGAAVYKKRTFLETKKAHYSFE
ncbi:MAG: DUF1659 domain-containing protein [Bacillota bacterium]|nr:DUF1659 domain-containing protein [Bacillota bacterium]